MDELLPHGSNEWYEENGYRHLVHAVPMVYHDPSDSDTIEEQLRELLASASPVQAITALVASLVKDAVQSSRDEVLAWMLNQMLEANRADVRAVQIGLAAGCSATATKTGPQWARQLGISKQAMDQGVQMVRRKWGLRKSRAMRSAQGVQHMQQAYRERAQQKRKRKTRVVNLTKK